MQPWGKWGGDLNPLMALRPRAWVHENAESCDLVLQVSNMFIVSLATADLTVGIVVMPIGAVYVLAVQWPFGLGVCQFWLAVDYTASTASILNLLVLSIDRYRSVTDPLRYMRRRTSRHAGALIAAAWSLSALWLLPIVAWHWMFTAGRRSVPPGMIHRLLRRTLVLLGLNVGDQSFASQQHVTRSHLESRLATHGAASCIPTG